ncbi:MAG: hypothetical protein V3S46_07260 [Nitrospinota bacterium]
MKPASIRKLTEKVEVLINDIAKERRGNERTKRLLHAAEDKIRELQDNGGGTNPTVLELTRQIGKLKNERKIIKSKVGKMAERLDKFYKDN